MEIALAVLLVLSFPTSAIAGLVIAVSARDRVRALEQCFADFQTARPTDSDAAAAPAQPQPPSVAAAVRPLPAPKPVRPAPAATLPPPAAAALA